MPDDFEPDVAGGGEPAGDEPVVDETSTPEGEPAEPQGDGAAEDTTSDVDDQQGSESTPAAGRSARLQKLLAKYGGDEDQMVDAYFEQANSMSELKQKFDELAEKLTQKQLTPEEEARQLAEDPDVKEIGVELANLDAEIKDYGARDKQLVSEYGQLETTIQALTAKLEFAPDDLTKMELKREIAEAKREQKDVARDWRSNQSALRNSNRLLQSAIRDYREAESKAKAKREQAKKLEWDQKADAAATKKDFSDSIRAEAAAYGIEQKSSKYSMIQQAIQNRLVTYLRSLGEEAEGIDIPEAVGLLFKEYAEGMGHKRRGRALAQAKDATRSKPLSPDLKATDPKAPPKDKTGNYWDPKFVRERAKQMLG